MSDAARQILVLTKTDEEPSGFTRLPVVAWHDPQKLMGIVSLTDLLKARAHHLEEEQRRERVLQMRLLLPLRVRQLRKTS
jgi:CBS domain containing-hemolysin-like protein